MSLLQLHLSLKVSVPIMLLRNLCLQEGLCNGSRLVVMSLRAHCIKGCLLRGDFHGQLRVMPRITLISADTYMSTISCKQFPVRVCFVMTINKSQGQSFDTVSVDLQMPVFSHGQFYVAMSRVSDSMGLHVLLPDKDPKTTLERRFRGIAGE